MLSTVGRLLPSANVLTPATLLYQTICCALLAFAGNGPATATAETVDPHPAEGRAVALQGEPVGFSERDVTDDRVRRCTWSKKHASKGYCLQLLFDPWLVSEFYPYCRQAHEANVMLIVQFSIAPICRPWTPNQCCHKIIRNLNPSQDFCYFWKCYRVIYFFTAT